MKSGSQLPEAKSDAGSEVLVFADEYGLLVQGPSDVASAVIDRLVEGTSSSGEARRPLTAADAAAIGASGVAVASTTGEYMRLTAESVAKVQQFGAQFDAGGAMRGWVKDGHQFAGQLTFQPVSLAAEQALALQTAAVSLALRSAIANVQKAVERVEGKVDRINRHLDSRLRGGVIGAYRHLQQVVDGTTKRGYLLEADWDSVAGLRSDVARDLETMREYVRLEAAEITLKLSVPKREEKLKAFHKTTGHAGDVLNLILVAEQSLHLWEYLRIQQVRRTDPDHVDSTLDDARESLEYQHEQDRVLVKGVRQVVKRARVVEALEVHRVLSKKGLDKQARIVDGRVREFAESARLKPPKPLGRMKEATISDTRDELQHRGVVAGRTARALGESAASSTSRLISKARHGVRGK